MNIVIKTYEGKCIVRPDTTWKRDDEGLYVPEFAGGISLAPIFYARISRAGRSIGEKFAARYYDGVGFGVLLFPEAMLDGSEQGYACASCLDHTTFLPVEAISPDELSGEYTLRIDGERLFEYAPLSTENQACGTALLCQAIAEASKYIYLRTGDILGIELSSRHHIWNPGQKEIVISTTLEDKELLRFYIR